MQIAATQAKNIETFDYEQFKTFIKTRKIGRWDNATLIKLWKAAELRKALLVIRPTYLTSAEVIIVKPCDYNPQGFFKPRFCIGRLSQFPMPKNTHYVFGHKDLIEAINTILKKDEHTQEPTTQTDTPPITQRRKRGRPKKIRDSA